MSTQLRVVLLVGVLLYLVAAIRMIHRKKLSLNYSLIWLLMALVMLVAVVWPQAVYALSDLLGVALPVNMIFLLFGCFAIIMLFYLTAIVSRDNEKNRTLTQQLGLMEQRLRELEDRLGEKKP